MVPFTQNVFKGMDKKIQGWIMENFGREMAAF